MGAPRFAKKRDASEKPLVSALRSLGVSVYLTDQPYDALLGMMGCNYLAEFKTPKTHYGKKLNDNQQEFAEVWLGAPPVILRTKDDVFQWFNSERRLIIERKKAMFRPQNNGPDGGFETPPEPDHNRSKHKESNHG